MERERTKESGDGTRGREGKPFPVRLPYPAIPV